MLEMHRHRKQIQIHSQDGKKIFYSFMYSINSVCVSPLLYTKYNKIIIIILCNNNTAKTEATKMGFSFWDARIRCFIYNLHDLDKYFMRKKIESEMCK